MTTYRGREIQTLCGIDVIEVHDLGVKQCPPSCALMEGHGGCVNHKYDADNDTNTRLLCGVNNTIYIRPNDDEWDNYIVRAVQRRMEGWVPDDFDELNP